MDSEKYILKLERENEDLKSKLTDLLFEQNYNKQAELIEFLREIYDSVNMELKDAESSITREDLLYSFKKHIEEFARNNRIQI